MTEPFGGPAPEARSSDAPRARATPGTPLYVHLPFCAAKCPYCDFYSVAAEGQDRATVWQAILAEAEERAPEAPRTVFLGGGTPSLLDADELGLLLDGLDRLTGFRRSATEVTAECNPESLDRAKAERLLELGVDRLSIGFQSLRQATLELFGRVHDVEQSFTAFDAARAAGCEAVSVDLIYAAPGQTAAEWSADLSRVLDLGPDHLSAYNLTYEEGTPFRRWLEDGRLERLPEDVELEMFWTTRELAAKAGLGAYEVSNFGSASFQCAHNVNYWRNGAYVGLGPSAVSKVGDTRSGNVRSIAAYLRDVTRHGCRADWSETPPASTRLAETWWLGLRVAEGLTAAEARQRAGWGSEPDPAVGTARELGEQGLLTEAPGSDGRFVLSQRGLPLADHIARRFLKACAEPVEPG